MTPLSCIIRELDHHSDSMVIYAAPRWRADSAAVVCAEPDDGSLPEQAQGLTYLMPVATAKRVVKERLTWRRGQAASLAEKLESVIYYAVYEDLQPPPSVFRTDDNCSLATG